ncbi:MAG: hypothetical protein ACOCRX_08920, partial [Candidatus Woesearchaeota archaeon]
MIDYMNILQTLVNTYGWDDVILFIIIIGAIYYIAIFFIDGNKKLANWFQKFLVHDTTIESTDELYNIFMDWLKTNKKSSNKIVEAHIENSAFKEDDLSFKLEKNLLNRYVKFTQKNDFFTIKYKGKKFLVLTG